MKKISLFKSLYIQHFCSSGKSFKFLATKLRQACRNFIVHVRMNVFTNRFLGILISFSSFPELEQKVFRVLTRKFWQGGHNCILHVHRNTLKKVIFLSTDFFSILEEGRKWGKIFFSKKLHCYHFQTLNEKYPQCPLQAWLRQACQKIVVHVQTNIFVNRFFAKLIFFSSFSGIPAKSFQSFDENVLTGWSQLRSTCTDVQKHNFRENIFLSKNW